MVVPLCPFLADGNRVGGVVGIFLQILFGQPTLYARAAFVGFYNANRHVEGTAQQTCKEITRSRELAYCLRRTNAPVTLCVVQRLAAHHTGNLDAAHTLRVNSIQNVVVVILHWTHAETFDRHLHIRLSCTDPYLAREYIINSNCSVTVVESDAQRGVGSLWRLHRQQELTVLTSFHGTLLLTP